MPHGAIEWMEIPAADLSRSTKFYESVFGWKIQRSPEFEEYPMFMDGSGHVGGGFTRTAKVAAEGGVLIYITVDSIDAMLPKIGAAGGQTKKEKTKISDNVGWWASFSDPGGNTIGLFEKSPTHK